MSLRSVLKRIAAAYLAALALSSAAHAQVSGILDWSTLGIADEAVMPQGTTSVSAGVTTTVTWTTTTDGGSFVAHAGGDFVSYESSTQGGFTGFAQVGFDNERQDAADKVTVEIAFSEAVAGLQFSLTEIDEISGGSDDFVEVYYNAGAGFVNARTGSFETLGADVARDNENSGNGWEGTGSSGSSSTDGNIDFDFGTFKIVAVRIVYFSGNDAGNKFLDPAGQQIGISDVTYDKIMPLLTIFKTVATAGPTGNDRFAIPGNDVFYTLTVTNSGDGTVDADTLFVADPIPAEVEFFNSDIDGAGPAIGPVYFTQSGAALIFTLASDVAYSNSAVRPTSISDCAYTPNPGYDPNVRHLCLNPKGKMLAGDPDPTFSVQFRARIK